MGFNRSAWLRRLLTWHWVSSALALSGMLLFAATGITLNHAGQISVVPDVQTQEAQLPAGLRERLSDLAAAPPAELPDELRHWLQREQDIHPGVSPPEWSEYEFYLSMPRPGGDAWLSIDLASGELLYEVTDRGWVAYLNDLHKGRNTGTAWVWFIDILAAACVVFCLTGFAVLFMHARERPSVWPVTGLGILVPLLLASLLVH